MTSLLIIGVSGVTCGGKTTIATKLHQLLPESKIISQDEYFLPVDDPRHIYIPELNHINFDVISSLDMDRLYSDVLSIISYRNLNLSGLVNRYPKARSSFKSATDLQMHVYAQAKAKLPVLEVLIIEGFSIFNYPPLLPAFHVKYYFTLSEEECRKRRMTRLYEPPDCPGYFEKCVWPEHLKQLEEVKTTVDYVRYYDGELDTETVFEAIVVDLLRFF